MSLVTNVSTYIFETFSETPREITVAFFSGEIEITPKITAKTKFALHLIFNNFKQLRYLKDLILNLQRVLLIEMIKIILKALFVKKQQWKLYHNVIS